MSKKTFYVLMAVLMVSIPGFSAQERVVTVQNSVRVGYDDNVYLRNDKTGSGFITDILTINGKFNMSGRTEALLYWQPELRYRFDADPKTVSYQDLYAKLDHAMSERTSLTISDRLRYQIRDGQSGTVSQEDQNYLENSLLGAVNIDTSDTGKVKLGAGYDLRRWDDSTYGGGDKNNDWDKAQLDASYLQMLNQMKTTGILAVNYSDLEYNGDRGGYEAVSLIGGVDQVFNPTLTGFGRVGITASSVDNSGGSSTDSTTPYLDAGLDYRPSERTSLNGSFGYSIKQAENSVYNAQDEFNIRFGARHDLTGKISLAASISYIISQYKADYIYKEIVGLGDADDNFFLFNLRATYQINRNNFLEAGYGYSNRSTDYAGLTDYDRNVVDIGWRLRL
jgi:hypothetical protein